MKKNIKENRRRLRSGSKAVKHILYKQRPCCDICGKELPFELIQLHHIKMIRWGYKTDIFFCRLLCPNCHRAYHSHDRYLDKMHARNPNMDYITVYEKIKHKIQGSPP